MRRIWLLRLGVVLVVGGSAYACRGVDGAGVDTGNATTTRMGAAGAVCKPGATGCLCDTEGASAACGYVKSQSGNYVSCAIGNSTCKGGAWGACVQDYVVTKSVGKSTLAPGTTHILATTTNCPSTDPSLNTDGGICDNPCDIDQFTITTSDAGDVDAASTLRTDAGLTINPTCADLSCQIATCPAGSPTTITGTVYDPAGVNPLYNALVYIPVDPSGQLPAFSAGASCNACAGIGSVPVMASAVTGPDGKFTLTNVPTTDVAPQNPIPLVVELGKWRRQVLLTSVPQCATTALTPDSSRLPRNKFDGFNGQADIPKMAIATGSQDPFQCLFLKMGIDPAEFQLPNDPSNRRIDYYVGDQGTQMQFGAGTAPPRSSLVGSTSTLMQYDAVILPCDSRPGTSTLGNFPEDDQFADNVAAYANGGGRVFATHYAVTWLAMPRGISGGTPPLTASATNPATGSANPFFGVANWALESNAPVSPLTANIDTGTAKGMAFSSWMQNVGASSAPGQLAVSVARQDTNSVTARATEYIRNNDLAPDGGVVRGADGGLNSAPLLFSFDTPVGSGSADGGGGACGRVNFADFHVSSNALANSRGTCNTDADCGFGTTCGGGSPGTCISAPCGNQPDDCGHRGMSDCIETAGTMNTCVPQPCQSDVDCESGVCNPNGTCGCTMGSQCKSGTCDTSVCVSAGAGTCVRTEDCGNSEVCTSDANPGICRTLSCTTDADCAAGCPVGADCGHELCVSGSCTGCLSDNDCQGGNCVGGTPKICSQHASTFPLACAQVPLTPQEAALEFMLFDLTSCVSTAPPLPPPPPTYKPATFVEDFASNCPDGTRPVWREVDWISTIPPTAEIDFFAQTADPMPDGGLPDYTMVPQVTVAKETTSGLDHQFLDTGNVPGTMGVFNLATPPIFSRSDLRLTVTLKPTTDTFAAPTLVEWSVKADCLVAE